MYISCSTYRDAVPHLAEIPEDNSHITITPNSPACSLASRVPVYSSDVLLENDEVPDNSAEVFAVPDDVEILSDREKDVSVFI